jgi:adenylate kinase family enzyme
MSNYSINPIFFVLGPSGVGKSTYGQLLAEHLGYSYFELDDIQKSNNPTLAKILKYIILKKVFFKRVPEKPEKMAKALTEFVRKNATAGIVVGFRSKPYYSIDDCIFLENQGIRIIYLDGPADLCQRDFLKREKESKPLSHWTRCNVDIYLFYQQNKNRAPRFFINTFTEDGKKIPERDIFQSILSSNAS